MNVNVIENALFILICIAFGLVAVFVEAVRCSEYFWSMLLIGIGCTIAMGLGMAISFIIGSWFDKKRIVSGKYEWLD